MRAFAYARPRSVAEAVSLLVDAGPRARVLAGGTDLIIRLRDGTLQPDVVVDIKRIPELRPAIELAEGVISISAGTVMTDIAADARMRRHFPALVEAAEVVGSVQIRNRATLAGNICNASPAADTIPALLVYSADVVIAGHAGERRQPLDELLVASGRTTLVPGEFVTAIELPLPRAAMGATHVRRTRRRGHDLASVTLCCGIDVHGVTRIAYGSLGPRAILVVDETGALADPATSAVDRSALFDRLFADASPSPRSMRAGPEYRLAMLRVLASRALDVAHSRLAEA